MRSVQLFEIEDNRPIARDTFLLELEGDTTGITRPGQFVNVAVPGFYLRRPLSVCRWREGHLTLLYKVLGEGTDALTRLTPGQTVDVLSGLGNGFTVPAGIKAPLIVGGGIGVAPLLALTEELLSRGTQPQVVFGFATADEISLVEEITSLGVTVTTTTVDGSAGVPGFVTNAMTDALPPWDYVYACGPTPMLQAVHAAAGTPGQYSMEERMACGFGACMGCVLETTTGLQRVCKEGPVFESEDLPW